MKFTYLLIPVILICAVNFAIGQQTSVDLQGMIATNKNFTTFSAQRRNVSTECNAHNRNNSRHPELGLLFPEAPISDCYEVLEKRTTFSKTYLKEGSNGKEIMLQTSTEPMHFTNSNGQLLTIDSRLKKAGSNVYAAMNQPIPIRINTDANSTVLGNNSCAFTFNNKLELIYLSPLGKETLLSKVNWANHTAGDDGVYVTDAFPGIDMEISVSRGAVKTNYYINHPQPTYSSGKLLIRDHFNSKNQNLHLYAPKGNDYKGNIAVQNKEGKPVYVISAATVYESGKIAESFRMIGYNLDSNSLDIVVPGEYMNRPIDAYPIVIDPLVTTATNSAVGGSSYSPTKTVSCNYVNAATVPANVRVTDVRWSFNYITSGGALLLHGATDFTVGACRSPATGGFFWYCNLPSAGTCTGTNISIFPDVAACIPPPQCASYPLNLGMRFYQNFATTPPCANTYVTAGSPLTVTVFGRTVETSPVSAAGGLISVCLGQSVTLSTTPSFGVPPYNYIWNPSATVGNPATLTPTTTTPYTVTVTDACGQAATATQTILVSPLPAITGSNIVCTGGTIALSNPSGAGTWSSTNSSVGVVGPTSGIVTGISAGTTTISFVNSTGCFATKIVTVVPMPTTISGPREVCAGASITLSNPIAGGTWSSSNLSVATVGLLSGVITGASSGSTTISYITSPGCAAATIVTVYAIPTISFITTTSPTSCGGNDGTITLHGLDPFATYTLSYFNGTIPISLPVVADAGGNVLVAGFSAGTYSNIRVTSVPMGCTSPLYGPITLVDIGAPPAPIAGTNAPICEGEQLDLLATTATGVTFQWSGPGGFSSTLQNPSISPASGINAGVYSVTTSLLGCISLPGTVNVIINPIPHIDDFSYTNPVTCNGNEGSIKLIGLVPGTTYNIGYEKNGTPVFVSITADGSGHATVYGLSAGTYDHIFAENATCVSKQLGPINLIDPEGPPPSTIGSNAPICVGRTLLLYGDNSKPGGTYSWSGPNSFTSNEQNPTILYTTIDAEGVYTLSYTRLNCTSTVRVEIKLQPVVKLTNVVADKYQIAFGDSAQLSASGATYYIWTPHDKTLSDYYIFNPVATPRDSVTLYRVFGMNEWGCRDSADIVLRVIFDEVEYIPNAFTPNGDGKNDIFRIGKMQYKKLIDFTVYNRWGQEVYHNPYDPNGGWDGTTRGIPQDMGVYFYSITLESASGKLRYYKGDVTLIR